MFSEVTPQNKMIVTVVCLVELIQNYKEKALKT